MCMLQSVAMQLNVVVCWCRLQCAIHYDMEDVYLKIFVFILPLLFAFVSFWLLRLFDFLALGDRWLFGFGDLFTFLAFRFQAWLLVSTGSCFFSLFVAVDITVCVVVVVLWLIDFVACVFFFHLGFCGLLVLQVLTAFVAFGCCAFLPWLIGVWHLFLALAFAGLRLVLSFSFCWRLYSFCSSSSY